ncbi:adaptor-related protein complex 3 protein beta subunit [Reticulomyxa filosa]|uniref:Adaptor-related protein complex 3 protein beta subunit n=1 Tax=Reticulomyxa filosa TaxID=46433 RepID=X6M8T1_RETFI|nr:adaptor-related protein complex 3 protein beta subunit [Reticulomyxa filosa]|eukprot:ETO10071.1 adaptor-related protein complex 3 protein beta subunit [Reticulomyxa filosa]
MQSTAGFRCKLKKKLLTCNLFVLFFFFEKKKLNLQLESSMGNFKNMMSSISLVGDAKHFQEGRNKFDTLKQNLESKNEKQKLEAMKTLIAHMTLGRDVSQLFPHVVKNVIVDSMEVKKLVYMFVVHYAAQNQNLALLAISSFQKGKGVNFFIFYFYFIEMK